MSKKVIIIIVILAVLTGLRFFILKNDSVSSKDDLIKVYQPKANSKIQSPLTVTGEARGNWFFEASFPVKVLDEQGNLLGTGIAQAKSDWMTENYVPFEATVEFQDSATEKGTLVLKKDNPSGLPENDNELRIPVRFEKTVQYRTVNLYYYNPSLDQDESGNITCAYENRGIVPVQRSVPVTQTPIQDTINLLLKGALTEAERNQGITTEYPLEGLSLEGASLNNGVLTLEFDDPYNKTGGGSCRIGILWRQIETTAKQFSGISQVRFIPEWLFQP